MCQLLAVALMLSLCQQTSIRLWISKASYFMSYAWFLQRSLIGYCSLWLLKPFVVQPGSCSGPCASLHACLDRFCPDAMFPISLMPQCHGPCHPCEILILKRVEKEGKKASCRWSPSPFLWLSSLSLLWLTHCWGLLDITAVFHSSWAWSVTDFADVPTCPC